MSDSTEPKTAFQLVNPAGLYDPSNFGYSHVALLQPAARIAMIAGQGGEMSDGSLPPDFRSQVRQAMVNLATAAKGVGGDLQHIVKHTMLIVDFDEAKLHIAGEEMARAYNGHKPTGTLIPVPRLALDGMLFEIDAILAMPA